MARKNRSKARRGTPVSAASASPAPKVQWFMLAATLLLAGAVIFMMVMPQSRGIAQTGQPAAQPEPEVTIPGPPPIQFDPPELMLGVVETDQTITRFVQMYNPTDKPMRILTARGNCSCVRGELASNSVIPAHGTLPLSVAFDTLSNPSAKRVGINLIVAGYEQPLEYTVRASIVRPTTAGPASR